MARSHLISGNSFVKINFILSNFDRNLFILAFLLCLAVMGGIKARANDDPDPNINGNITQHSSFLPLNQGGGRFPAMPNNGFNNNNNFLQPFSRQQQPFVGLSPFQQQSNNPAQGFPGFPPTSQHLGLNALQSGGVDGHNSFNALGGASGNGFQQQQQQPGSFGSANTFQNQLAIQNQLALLSAQQQQPINSAAPGFFLPQQQQQLLQNGLLTGQNSQLLNNNNLLIQQSNNPFGLLALQQQQNPFVLQQQQPFGTNQQGTLFGLQQQQQQPFGGGNNQLTLLALQQLQQQNPLIFQQLQQQQNPFLSSNQLQPSSSAGLFGQQQQQQGINNINDFNSLQQQNNRFPSSNSNQILLQGGQFADSSPFSSNNNRFPTNNNNNAINPLFSNNQRQPFNSFGTSPGQHQSSFFNDRSLNFTNFNPTADSFTTFSNNPIFQQQQQQQSPFAMNPQQDAFSANGINPFVQQWNNNARLPFFASGSINNLQMLRGGPPPPQSELSLNSVIRPLPTNNITTDHQTQQQDTRFSCDGRVPGKNA